MTKTKKAGTKTSRKGLIAGISIGSVVIAVAITFGILYFFTDVFKKKAAPPSQAAPHRKPKVYEDGWGCGAVRIGTRGCTQNIPHKDRIYESKAMCELQSECGNKSQNADGFTETYWACLPGSVETGSGETECVESESRTPYLTKEECERSNAACNSKSVKIGWGCSDILSKSTIASSGCALTVGGPFKTEDECNLMTNTCQKIGYA